MRSSEAVSIISISWKGAQTDLQELLYHAANWVDANRLQFNIVSVDVQLGGYMTSTSVTIFYTKY
jgi:hypothetical protein